MVDSNQSLPTPPLPSTADKAALAANFLLDALSAFDPALASTATLVGDAAANLIPLLQEVIAEGNGNSKAWNDVSGAFVASEKAFNASGSGAITQNISDVNRAQEAAATKASVTVTAQTVAVETPVTNAQLTTVVDKSGFATKSFSSPARK